jgi:hypothetical protein
MYKTHNSEAEIVRLLCKKKGERGLLQIKVTCKAEIIINAK